MYIYIYIIALFDLQVLFWNCLVNQTIETNCITRILFFIYFFAFAFFLSLPSAHQAQVSKIYDKPEYSETGRYTTHK